MPLVELAEMVPVLAVRILLELLPMLPEAEERDMEPAVSVLVELVMLPLPVAVIVMLLALISFSMVIPRPWKVMEPELLERAPRLRMPAVSVIAVEVPTVPIKRAWLN